MWLFWMIKPFEISSTLSPAEYESVLCRVNNKKLKSIQRLYSAITIDPTSIVSQITPIHLTIIPPVVNGIKPSVWRSYGRPSGSETMLLSSEPQWLIYRDHCYLLTWSEFVSKVFNLRWLRTLLYSFSFSNI